jgi:hypothetical protein
MKEYTRKEIEAKIADLKKIYKLDFTVFLIHDTPYQFKKKRKFELVYKDNACHVYYKHFIMSNTYMSLKGENYELD